MDAVQEVKSRLNIEDVISEYVQLKRAGRNFKGLSPWTNEKTPSFMVSPEKQIWHDFSSGKGGDIFTFVMEMEGLDFRGTLELLARKAGVDLEQYRGAASSPRREFKARALEALELATKFYQKQLTVNETALKYLLRERGFSKKTLLSWQLGYSPNTGYALTDFLTKHGFTTDEMKRAGLSVVRGGKPADMFRGRIMVPLTDSRGTIVGFTARLLIDEPDVPKYINTPQTLVYDKSRNVFGLHLAKETIRKSAFVVIAEGNLDVISSHQADVSNVVATAGTAMTQQHLRELKRFTGDIRLCFDADTAGTAATERAIELAQKTGVNLSVVGLKGAKDPDELIKKDPKKWRQEVEKPKYALDWLIERYRTELDLKTAPGKRAFTDALLAVIRRLTDPVEQEHYLKKLAKLTDTSFDAVKAKFSSVKGAAAQPLRRPKVQPLDRSAAETQKLRDHLLAIMLMRPKLRKLLKNAKAEYFGDGPAKELFEFFKKNPEFTFEPDKTVSSGKKPQWRVSPDYVKIIILQFEELYQDLLEIDLVAEAQQLKQRLVDVYAKTQKQLLVAKMQTTTDEKQLHQLMQKVNELNILLKLT